MHAQTIKLADIEFWLVGSPVLLRNADGSLYEQCHEISEDQCLNPYAAGPFCRFGLPAAPTASGVYAILVGDELKYIGRCENLSARFSARGYGSISPRNLHNDGQSTNCKLNSRILSVAKAGGIAQVWFHHTADFVPLESELILKLNPEWNGRGRSAPVRHIVERPNESRARAGHETENVEITATKDHFDQSLQSLLESATNSGHVSIEVTAGHLHRLVGGYPGDSHRMPVCCARMRAAMRDGDHVTYSPPKGNGARLSIEYKLPR